MTAEKEFEGKTVKKAVQLAAKTLGIPDADVKYDVLSHGSTGIFGLASIKKARIKLRCIPTSASGADPIAETKYEEQGEAPTEEAQPQSFEQNEGKRIAEAILRRMVDAISPESTIAVEKSDRQLRFHIKGGQSSILIGKRGQTLEAMQLILDKAMRRLNGHTIRFQVDVEGYIAKKKDGLVSTAQRLAQKVITKGAPTSAGFLNAQERRIVHLALKNNPKVRTQSVGEGPFRKLMIYPKHKPRARR
jgi:spoIIIJ-associated protein